MKKKIKAVIFDMDGLMFDTEVVAAEMWKQAGKEAGLTITDEFLSHIKGCNWTRSRVWFYKYYDESYDFFAIRTRRMELVNRYLTENGVPVKKGLRELLSYLKERDYRIVLATSTYEEYALRYLEQTDVRKYFDGYVCGDMVTKSKPDPEIYHKAAAIAGAAPDECVVLEDSFNGIEAACAGGFVPVMVPDLDEPTDEIRAKLAARCDSLLDVMDFLEERQQEK